jgi:hypothetical protein
MFIRWQRRNLKTHPEGSRVSAILVESYRGESGPRSRHIAFIASIAEESLRNPSARRLFWDEAGRRLAGLSKRISAEEREKIESALALKVRCPTGRSRT